MSEKKRRKKIKRSINKPRVTIYSVMKILTKNTFKIRESTSDDHQIQKYVQNIRESIVTIK